jgi:alpha-L-fucosidase 2
MGSRSVFPQLFVLAITPILSILQQLKDRIALQSLPNGWITQGGGGIETLSAVPMTINEML